MRAMERLRTGFTKLVGDNKSIDPYQNSWLFDIFFKLALVMTNGFERLILEEWFLLILLTDSSLELMLVRFWMGFYNHS